MSSYGDNGPHEDSFDVRKEQAKAIIQRRLSSQLYDRGDLKDVAREVCDATNIMLTAKEVDDIHRGGW